MCEASASEKAYADALGRIKVWNDGEELDLSIPDLACIPSEIGALTTLLRLDCSNTQISDLTPLSGLRELIRLFCSNTKVASLGPLQKLSALKILDFSNTPVSDLAPLSGLGALMHLDCNGTPVSDLTPLSGLNALTSLSCWKTQVSNLAPLSGLSALTELDCSNTQVSDLTLLSNFIELEVLQAQGLRIEKPPNLNFWFQESLREVTLKSSSLPDIPAELLAAGNCLSGLRAHLSDLGDNPQRLEQARLLILGNGRIGKTQLRRRLCEEAYDESIASTHGIVVSQIPVPGRANASFHLWDFGGQEIYHGVHALFLRNRAAFLLGWTPEAETTPSHEHEGLIFRNHPLPYWLNQIRVFAGREAPLILTQMRCDSPQDRRDIPEAARTAAEAFQHQAQPTFSALNNRGRGALDEALVEAYDAIAKPQIGLGRAAVKAELERRIAEDADLPKDRRRHRFMTREEFEALCAQEGGVSQPWLFLDFLDAAGVVIAREGLFGGRILLDQNWALEAIYALFERKKVYQPLLNARGRFTREDLDLLFWRDQGHSLKDQELFIEMMRVSGVCFRYRTHEGGEKTTYIAPDLLPEETPESTEEIWSGRKPDIEFLTSYSIFPRLLIRGLICEIGEEARLRAEYWRSGVHFYDKTRESRVRAEILNSGDDDQGRIRLQAEGPKAEELAQWLDQALQNVETRYGLKGERQRRRTNAGRSRLSAPVYEVDPEQRPKIYVSYAWNERDGSGPDREAEVLAFCDLARAAGYEVIRDRERVGYGDSISEFMARLGAAERVAVFLSKSYLESPFCMSELHAIWREARQKPEDFLKRVRLWPVAEEPPEIGSLEARLQRAVFWRKRYEELDAQILQHGRTLLSAQDYAAFRAMGAFRDSIGDLLGLVADRVRARRLEDLLHAEDGAASARET